MPDTFIIKEDGSKLRISEIKKGDILLSFDRYGKITKTKVNEIIKIKANEYYIIKTNNVSVSATLEHPFYTGNGTYKTLESLKIGNEIYIYDGESKIKPQKIISIEKVKSDSYVYNLKVDYPNTFFANFIAVHNKGGCFARGTKIKTPDGEKNIEEIKENETIYTYVENKLIKAKIIKTHTTTDLLVEIEASGKKLKTTYEHPILTENGFKKLKEIKIGEKIAFFENKIIWLPVNQIKSLYLDEVYNLSVEFPNTFIANGFIVHNKGFTRGYYWCSYSSRVSKGNPNSLIYYILGALTLLYLMKNKKNSEGSAYLYPRSEIVKKSEKTEKLLEFLSKQDEKLNIDYLKNIVKNTFIKVQNSWEMRNYETIKDLLTPHIYTKHSTQLDIMKEAHEINIIEDLSVLSIDLVGLRYTIKEDGRFFTALITAQAKDYYIDDRTNQFLKGDATISIFQEFWTFKFSNGKWLLDSIEQTQESDILSREDFVEQFINDSVYQKIYEKDISKNSYSEAQFENSPIIKTNKITSYLNSLEKTDKMWNSGKMEIDSSLAFLKVYEAWVKRDPSFLNNEYISDEMIETLKKLIIEKKNEGFIFELRNLCIRKVEIVLVYNMAENGKDEFVVRFSAHAQKRILKANQIIMEDEYVKPFTEYWVFSRYDNRWKAKEILPKHKGVKAVYAENKDEDSSPAQLEWYYTKKRTY
ncbi:MAG: TIM44-like domain-containing protein [Elusimicrobiota bacterium]